MGQQHPPRHRARPGPGTRMTVFMAGCELRCQYCHNPDTWFTAKGTPVMLDEMVARISRYRGIFRATGGGITISGGEPMMQARYVGNLLHAAHEMGIHTCIDTCGFLGADVTDQMLDDLGLVLLDIKSGDPETYRRVTGQELEPTLRFARRLAERGIETWVRYVLVPGLTDEVANVQAVADFVATLGNVSRVEVLPFHQMGRDKYDSLGIDYPLADASPPSAELLERVRGQFRDVGVTVY
ncbi:pyruvate formate-lyase-activating protein [Luteococcus sediminum]